LAVGGEGPHRPGRQQRSWRKETEKYEKRNCFPAGIFICCCHQSTTNPTNGKLPFPVDRPLIGARYLVIMNVECLENGINALAPIGHVGCNPIDSRYSK
jgi:hypothetical protein